MFNSLINPNFPRAAVGLRRESVSVVNLQKQGRALGLRNAATVELAEGILQPDFFAENILEPNEVLATMREAASSAGMSKHRKWSVSLPADTARMAVVTLEAAPKSKAELGEVLNWKSERAFGEKPAEMRLAFQPLAPDENKRPRYFAVAVRLEVLAEYDELFAALGWHTGLVLPRHVSEAQWLTLLKTPGDAFMVSSQADGFTAILLRGAQPAVVRSVICDANELEDELFRLLLFYRDRFENGSTAGQTNLRRLLLIGEDFQKARLDEIAHETLGYDLPILGASEIGLILPDEIRFEDIAAPAALASLAFR